MAIKCEVPWEVAYAENSRGRVPLAKSDGEERRAVASDVDQFENLLKAFFGQNQNYKIGYFWYLLESSLMGLC